MKNSKRSLYALLDNMNPCTSLINVSTSEKSNRLSKLIQHLGIISNNNPEETTMELLNHTRFGNSMLETINQIEYGFIFIFVFYLKR
jgi:hypothetical protein